MLGLKQRKLVNSVSAAVITTLLNVTFGVGSVIATAAPALAQAATLTAEQIAAVQSQLQTALAAASTDADKQAAIAQTIEAAVNLYGAAVAGPIASAVMEAAEAAGVSPTVIGAAFAQASVAFAQGNNLVAANAVASTIGAEGNATERSSFQSAATSLGYATLASLAGGSPVVTGAITGGTGAGNGTSNTGNTTSTPSGCVNPSCTSL